MTSFKDSWQHRELLDISKAHLDAIDRNRMTSDGVIIGNDNYANLKVSTVFAAIAMEAAINDFLQIHCLFVDKPYLQEFFVSVTDRFLFARVDERLAVVRRCLDGKFPDALISDARRLFQIRNRVVHQSGEFIDRDKENGLKSLTNRPLDADSLRHMLRHHEIADEFLGSFWLPGTRELESKQTT